MLSLQLRQLRLVLQLRHLQAAGRLVQLLLRARQLHLEPLCLGDGLLALCCLQGKLLQGEPQQLMQLRLGHAGSCVVQLSSRVRC
jgi:hypothetical protein